MFILPILTCCRCVNQYLNPIFFVDNVALSCFVWIQLNRATIITNQAQHIPRNNHWFIGHLGGHKDKNVIFNIIRLNVFKCLKSVSIALLWSRDILDAKIDRIICKLNGSHFTLFITSSFWMFSQRNKFHQQNMTRLNTGKTSNVTSGCINATS